MRSSQSNREDPVILWVFLLHMPREFFPKISEFMKRNNYLIVKGLCFLTDFFCRPVSPRMVVALVPLPASPLLPCPYIPYNPYTLYYGGIFLRNCAMLRCHLMYHMSGGQHCVRASTNPRHAHVVHLP